jgi:hypothetical protein
VNRRDALRTLAAGAVGAASSVLWVESLTALARAQAQAHVTNQAMAAPGWTPRVLTAPQNETVVTLTDLIIPETDTPGAKAVLVNRFIDQVLFESPSTERETFLRGVAWMDERSRTLFAKDFVACTTADQTALLTRISDDENKLDEERIGREFFQAIKSMTISGYYSSEIGLTRELGDSGAMFLLEFAGCDHPEHQG